MCVSAINPATMNFDAQSPSIYQKSNLNTGALNLAFNVVQRSIEVQPYSIDHMDP